MSVKNHLGQICSLEKTIFETEQKLKKHREKKKDTEENITKKRKELEQNVGNQQKKLDSLASLRNRRSNFTFKGTKTQKRITFIVCLITILVQIVLTAILVGCFGPNNYTSVSIVYTIIYAVFVSFFLYMEYEVMLKFPVFQTIVGIVVLAILFYITNGYFKMFSNIGVNVIGANVVFTLFIVTVEIVCGASACKRAVNEQRKQYKDNRKWLNETAIELKQLQSALRASQQELLDFNRDSKLALDRMSADILALEKHLDSTKKNLKDVYSRNVLHQNYQNWVAAATMYEYFDVGRCYELKGPDGAYNLYEKELLANKILDSLSAINSSINYQGTRIYNSQFYIRSQLSECNRNLEHIVINTYGF